MSTSQDSPSAPSRPLVPPHGGNDEVYTPAALAWAIVHHFRPTGRMLEPCVAQPDGCHFLNALSARAAATQSPVVAYSGMRILGGTTNFLTIQPPYLRFDWIITNPPWSQFRSFLKHAMHLADNVVFLAPINHLFLKARLQDIAAAGFSIVEIAQVPTPPPPWPQSGFQIAAMHLGRRQTAHIIMSRLPVSYEAR